MYSDHATALIVQNSNSIHVPGCCYYYWYWTRKTTITIITTTATAATAASASATRDLYSSELAQGSPSPLSASHCPVQGCLRFAVDLCSVSLCCEQSLHLTPAQEHLWDILGVDNNQRKHGVVANHFMGIIDWKWVGQQKYMFIYLITNHFRWIQWNLAKTRSYWKYSMVILPVSQNCHLKVQEWNHPELSFSELVHLVIIFRWEILQGVLQGWSCEAKN